MRYLHQNISNVFDFWQQYSTKYVLQFTTVNYVTLATYWVPGLPDFYGFSGLYLTCILIFRGDASFAWSSKHINALGRLLFLASFFWAKNHQNIEIRSVGPGNECVAMETWFYYISRCVTLRTIDVPSFNCFCKKLTKIAPLI